MPPRLTKSRFKLAWECPTKLYYAANPTRYPSTKESPFLQALAEGGYQVGELAKVMHPGGVEVTTLDEARALAETAKLLERKDVTVFEAALGVPDENLLVRVDVLRKKGKALHLVEVKAKSYDPERGGFFNTRGELEAGWVPYLVDIAFQTYVARRARPGATVKSSLLLANKRAVATVDGIHQRFLARRTKDPESGRERLRCEVTPGTTLESVGAPLLVEVPVDDEVAYLLDTYRDDEGRSFDKLVRAYAKVCSQGKRVPPNIGSHCAHCEFRLSSEDLRRGEASGFLECWHEATGHPEARLAKEPLVLDLWDGRKKGEWIAEGITFLREIDEESLGESKAREGAQGLTRVERQRLQISKAKKKDTTPYLDARGLAREMKKLVWPLHFIDFETTTVALPFTAGRRPYETHAFQFSHHVMHEDGRVVHHGQYLDAERGTFPNFRFLRALEESLGDGKGSIIHFAPHENSVLAAIREQLLAGPKGVRDAKRLVRFVESIASPRASDTEAWTATHRLVDLRKWVLQYHYDPRTGGSNSIKYVLPALLESSPYLQKRYGKPTYGTPELIPSLNFVRMQWLDRDPTTGRVTNPYDKLPPLFADYPELGENDLERLLGHDDIKEGGAAMAAYARMQFEQMSDAEVEAIRKGLLKYCELDTLAMVMVFEAFREAVTKGTRLQ